MKSFKPIGFCGLLIAVAAVACVARATQSDGAKELLGEYVMVDGEEDGKALPKERVEGNIVRITDDTIASVDKADKEIFVVKYKVDTSHRPFKLEMTVAGGPRGTKGDKASGIIERDGELVRFCYAPAGGKVPTTFKTKAGDRQICFTMKRKKKD